MICNETISIYMKLNVTIIKETEREKRKGKKKRDKVKKEHSDVNICSCCQLVGLL